MAQLQTTQTGFRVITRVQGRVCRREQSTAARVGKKAVERRRVCLLSARDARLLEEYGVSQPCFGLGCHHKHYTRSQVEHMVKDGMLRWVGRSQNVAAWPEDRRWISKRSQGFAAMQLVDVSQMKGKTLLRNQA